MKKLTKIALLFLISILVISTSVSAAFVSSENASFEIVENNICTINITDKAVFEKKIIDYDIEKSELTIGLKVTNNAVLPLDKPSEIVLVIDNSRSMKNTISTGGIRMEAVIDSAKVLSSELLKLDTVNLSVISFSTGENRGTISDAELRTGLTNSKDVVLNAIDSIYDDFIDLIENDDPTSPVGVTTNIEAGVTLASSQFTGNCENKFIVLLTDGVPNVSIGSDRILYSGITATNTKNALLNIDNQGIQLLSMMTGLGDRIETAQTNRPFRELAEEVFGSPEDPTVGKFYNITDSEIEETISKVILDQLIAPQEEVLNNIDIYDYFPQDIVDNFDFEYVTSPNIGTVSPSIDLQNNVIVWHIDKLGYGEVATLSYKLKLKDKINEEISDVILDTNEKVDITTDNVLDEDGQKVIISSDVTPKVKVILKEPEPEPTPDPEPKPEPKPEPPKDDTTAPNPIPQTGATILGLVIILGAIIICIIQGIKYFKNNKELK